MKLLKGIEFIALFIGIPLTFLLFAGKLPRIPILLLVMFFVTLSLYRDKKFRRTWTWKSSAISTQWKPLAIKSGIVFLGLIVFTLLLTPELLFGFPRLAPAFWLLVIFLYPLVSAFPQELIYRTFLFHRYAALFPTQNAMVIASTVSYSFLHIIYENGIAIILTFIAGYVFSRTYQQSKSLFVVTLEHGIYGVLVFTVGLGVFFFRIL